MMKILKAPFAIIAALALAIAIPTASQANELVSEPDSNPMTIEEFTKLDPDQTIYVDAPMPTVGQDTRSALKNLNEGSESWVQRGDAFGIEPKEGEIVKVIYSDGAAFSIMAAGCTESLGISNPVKSSPGVAAVTGTFYISTGCANSKKATVAIYSGLAMRGSHSTTASRGATTTISAGHSCKGTKSTSFYGISAWAAGGSNTGGSKSLSCGT